MNEFRCEHGFYGDGCLKCQGIEPLSDDAVLSEVPILTDENIQELREIILDHNSSKTSQNKKIREWFVRHLI